MYVVISLVALISFLMPTNLYAESHGIDVIPSANSEKSKHPTSEGNSGLSGIQFLCSAEANAKILKEFKHLFEEYGWTAPDLVKTHLAKDGTQLTLTLNSSNSDTSTIDLFERKQFKIKPDSDFFVDRTGKAQSYQVASQKEIIASLLQHGRLTEFQDSFCSFEKFLEHVKLRQNIVKWGVRAIWRFPEDGITKINPKLWNSDWSLKPGIQSTDAIADAFIGDFNYEIGCTKACQKIMAQGILDFFKNVKKDQKMSEHLNQITHPTPLDTMEMKVDGPGKKYMIQEGTLVDRHFNVPFNNWIPGDWGWIKNSDEESAEEFGFEGCNIVYIGGGKFVVYYESDPDRTLDEALLRVYGWRRDSKEQPISQALVNLVRKDPRDGGLLRDVRDFPKNFTLPATK